MQSKKLSRILSRALEKTTSRDVGKRERKGTHLDEVDDVWLSIVE